MIEERRNSARMKFSNPRQRFAESVDILDYSGATVLDVSPTGMAISTGQAITPVSNPKGMAIHGNFVDVKGGSLNFQGTIQWWNEGTVQGKTNFRYGIKFHSEPAWEPSLIAKMMAAAD